LVLCQPRGVLRRAQPGHARQAAEYMRDKQVFAKGLTIPDAAFAMSVELMKRAGLIDDTAAAAASKALYLSTWPNSTAEHHSSPERPGASRQRRRSYPFPKHLWLRAGVDVPLALSHG
jgi:hypothetical protein